MQTSHSFLRSFARTAATAAALGLCLGTGAVVALNAFPGSPSPIEPDPIAFTDALPVPTAQLAANLNPAR